MVLIVNVRPVFKLSQIAPNAFCITRALSDMFITVRKQDFMIVRAQHNSYREIYDWDREVTKYYTFLTKAQAKSGKSGTNVVWINLMRILCFISAYHNAKHIFFYAPLVSCIAPLNAIIIKYLYIDSNLSSINIAVQWKQKENILTLLQQIYILK